MHAATNFPHSNPIVDQEGPIDKILSIASGGEYGVFLHKKEIDTTWLKVAPR